MKDFAIGLVIGLVGAVLWVLVSLVGGAGEAIIGEVNPTLRVLMYIGGVVMVGGPLVFWVILPIRRRISRRGR